MKNRRSLIEFAGLLIFLGLLVWQQAKIATLRRELAGTPATNASVFKGPLGRTPEADRAETAGLSSIGPAAKAPEKAATDLATLQEEIQTLKQQNEAWEGTEPPEEAPVEVGFPVPPGVRSDQIKVYMDTTRVAGWNEVDAVELVGADGSRQWAAGSSASSYFGDRQPRSSK